MITEQQLLYTGYTKYLTEHKYNSDVFYQKKFTDAKGIRYFLEFLHYPTILYSNGNSIGESFSMEMVINDLHVNFMLHYVDCIKSSEVYADKVWKALGSIYYELYN